MVVDLEPSGRPGVALGDRLRAARTRRHARPVPRPTSLRRAGLRDLVPVAIGFALVVVLGGLWAQFAHPFIAHDDWNFMLPVEPARLKAMNDRLLWEGRLLNWVVWRGPGHLMTPLLATLVFELGYLAMITRIAWRWAPGWLSLVASVALFASPMMTDLSFWPATLWPSVVLGAIAVGTLERCAERYLTLAGWIFLATVLTFLVYPPMTWMLFVVLAAELIDRRFRDLLFATVVYGVSYVGATLALFTFNLAVFGKFGLEYQQWRKPNELRSFADLAENLRRCGVQFEMLFTTTTAPLIIGGAAVLVCLTIPELRRRAQRWVLVALVVVGLISGATIVAGTINTSRSYAAVWLLAVLPVLWLITERAAVQLVRLVALGGLVTVAVWGVLHAQNTYSFNQDKREAFNRDEALLMDVARLHPGARLTIIGSDRDWGDSRFREEVLYLMGKIQNDHGLHVQPCVSPSCDDAMRPAVVAKVEAGERAFYVDGSVMLLPSVLGGP